MYVFEKDGTIEDTIELSVQTCWLFGREAAVVDVLLDERGASKQHAVIQFRYLEKKNEWGERKGKVRPYVIDLESKAGTILNGTEIGAGRYVELRDGDAVTFGGGKNGREYVLQLPKA